MKLTRLTMPQCAFLSVVFMMAFVMLFDRMHCRRQCERLAAVTGTWNFGWTPQKLLSPYERANRLYAMGEYAAAAELLVKAKASERG
jgi:hypothetical protein